MVTKTIHELTQATSINDADELMFQIENGGAYRRIAKSLLSSSGVNGSVFIYDLVPDTGNISKNMAENDTRVDSAVADASVSVITVKIFAYTGNSNVRPSVTVNGSDVVFTTNASQNPTAYLGSVDITMNTGTLIATHEDGASHTVVVSGDIAPVISDVIFINGYPSGQIELKENDNYDVSVSADINFIAIEVDNSGAAQAQTITGLDTTTHTFTCNIADRGTTTQDLPIRVRVMKSTGTFSDWVYSNVSASVDGVNTVKLNNLYPTVGTMSQSSITYPSSQEAIKDAETVSIVSVCSDYDTISYTSPTGELNIPDSTVYSSPKTNITRVSGDYNVSSINYTITATRTANNAVTTASVVVYIANVEAEITVTEPHTYLRSGGADGTSEQSHTITLTSNQNLISIPTIADLASGAGTWSGTFNGSGKIYTRTMLVNDSDTKGAYNYGTLSATNLAGKVTTTYTGDNTYTLRGFVSREIALAAFANEVNMNVAAVTYANVTMTWSFKSLPNKRSVGTTATPDADSWCLNTLNTNPTVIRILDTAATSSSSQESTITIEETI